MTVRSMSGLEVHGTQVLRAEGIELGSQIVERRHVWTSGPSFKQRRESVDRGQRVCIPLVDPGLNDVAVGCGIFNGCSNQGLGPLAVPLTVFVQRIENLAEQVIILAQ